MASGPAGVAPTPPSPPLSCANIADYTSGLTDLRQQDPPIWCPELYPASGQECHQFYTSFNGRIRLCSPEIDPSTARVCKGSTLLVCDPPSPPPAPAPSPPPLITVSISGGSAKAEQAVIHNGYYRTIFDGGVVSANDWVTWVPGDHVGGSTACQGAAVLAASAGHNDFIHGSDDVDDNDHDDLGGLVRSADIDGDGKAELFADLQLLGGIDGRTDPDVGNDSSSDLRGNEHPSSTYSMCFADASENGDGAYSISKTPVSDYKFTHLPNVKLYVQVRSYA